MAKKIKIAVNTRFLISDKLEGIGTYTHQVLQRLVKLMPEVEFHFLFDRAWSPEFIYAPNVVPHQIGLPARHPFLWYLWFEHSVSAWLKKNPVDLFLSLDSFLSLKTQTRTILVMHDLAFEHFPSHNSKLVGAYYRHFFPKYAQKAKQILAVSKFTQQDIINTYQIPPDKIDVAYCGVAQAYQPLNQPQKTAVKNQLTQGAPYYICIGSLNPRKNLKLAVQAFNLFKTETKDDTKLVVVGAAAWKTNELLTQIENSPFKNDIIRTGHLTPAVLSKYLAAADALLFPSHFEGFGIPIVEALQCQVPVITSDVSSTQEIGADVALLINPNDATALKTAMQTVRTDIKKTWINPETLKQKQALYNWDKTAQKFKTTIQKQLANQ